MNKQLTAKAPRYSFFFSIKNILINLIGIPKIEMIRLSCGFVLLRAEMSLNSEEFHKVSLYSLLVFCHSLL